MYDDDYDEEDYEEDYEEQEQQEIADTVIESQFDEKLNFSFELPISLEVGRYVQASIDKLVSQKVEKANILVFTTKSESTYIIYII